MAGNFGGRPRQQNQAFLVVLMIAFILVVLGLAFIYVSGKQDKQVATTAPEAQPVVVTPEEKKVTILVPLQDIKQGTQLQVSMFKKIEKPESMVDERAIRDFEGINQMYAKTLLVANNPVMQDFVQSTRPVVAIPIPPGYRAVTIRVNATTSVEGWARAESKVDVNFISFMHGKRCLTTIVQCARVVSAERQTSSATPQGVAVPSTITLVVTAADAKKIQLAEASQGQISLDLRGDDTVCTVDENRGTYCEGDNPNGESNKPKACTNIVIVDGRKWCADRRGLVPLNEDLDD